jgi:hypothetical protein
MAAHSIQIQHDEATGEIRVRHYVRTDIEPEEGVLVPITHHVDVAVPDDLKPELDAVLAKLLAVDRKAISRKARGHASRHEFHAYTLPHEVAEGRIKVDANGGVHGNIEAPPEDNE